jgi:hypothetical protein
MEFVKKYNKSHDIEKDICSFGNPAYTKEHWLQIYPSLYHFDHLVVRLKTTVLAPSLILFRDPLII